MTASPSPALRSADISFPARELRIGGCAATELAREYGTPLYAYDEAGLRRTCREYLTSFQAEWPGARVAYACKAFATTAMLKLAAAEGLGVDVMSPGELALAQRAEVPPADITYHGVAKTADDIELAVAAGVGHVVIDDLPEVAELAMAAARHGRVQPVLLRINPAVDVSTDARYRVGGADSKFGLRVPGGGAAAAFAAVARASQLRLDGLHFHLGSQLTSAEPYAAAMTAVAAFLDQVPDWRPRLVVAGGGMGVRYAGDPQVPSPGQWARWITAEFRRRLAGRCAPGVVLGIEPGRSVVAAHGTTLYTVGSVKRAAAGPATVVVDGGLSDNPRPLMYSAVHEVSAAAPGDGGAAMVADIYGRHCETDLLFSGVTLPEPRRGAILAVAATGAYTHCMASNYNRFARPAVVFARDGASRLVVRRETVADLLAAELG